MFVARNPDGTIYGKWTVKKWTVKQWEGQEELPDNHPELNPSPIQAEQFKSIERAIEQHMDAVAQSDNWDNRWICVARAGYVNQWQAKGIAFGQWMDACWSIAIQAQIDVISGTRPMPTPKQAVAELPAMVW